MYYTTSGIRPALLKGVVAILCGVSCMVLTACTSLLPTGSTTVASPCASFGECTKIFEQIVPYKTKIDDLKNLGIDPTTTANVNLLNYADVIGRFSYSAEHHEVFPQGVRECIKATSACRGYDLIISHVEEERTGNVLLDILNFKRKSEKKGWIFKTLLLVQDDLIVYKLMGGVPKVDESSIKNMPLGPFQSLDIGKGLL